MLGLFRSGNSPFPTVTTGVFQGSVATPVLPVLGLFEVDDQKETVRRFSKDVLLRQSSPKT